MTPEQLIEHFDRIAEAPDAVARLRRFVLDLAVRGKLVPQSPEDEPVTLPPPPRRDNRIFENPAASETLCSQRIGWRVVPVSDVLELQYGKAHSKTDRASAGPVPVYGSNGIVGYSEVALSQEPAIIIGRKGSAGALNVAEGPSWTTDVAYFVVPPTFLGLRYLYFALVTLDLGMLSKGVKPGLSRADVAPLPLSIPPLAEQKRIVEKVDELMATCDELETRQQKREQTRNRLVTSTLHQLTSNASAGEAAGGLFREKAKFYLDNFSKLATRPEHVNQLREAISDLAVRGKLVSQDPSEETADILLEQVKALRRGGSAQQMRRQVQAGDIRGTGSPIPDGWVSVPLGELASQITSGSRSWAQYYADEGAVFIRAQNIRFGTLDLRDVARVKPPTSAEGSRTRAIQGDLLVVITGAGVTHPARLDRDLGETYVSQHVGLVVPLERKMSRWLLLTLMARAAGRSQLLQAAYGSGKPGLNLNHLRTLRVPIPPASEQVRILARFDGLMGLCDQLESRLSKTTASSQRFMKATLFDVVSEPRELILPGAN